MMATMIGMSSRQSGLYNICSPGVVVCSIQSTNIMSIASKSKASNIDEVIVLALQEHICDIGVFVTGFCPVWNTFLRTGYIWPSCQKCNILTQK
jgi:hypothetical protein